jgi:hypothetical protein
MKNNSNKVDVSVMAKYSSMVSAGIKFNSSREHDYVQVYDSNATHQYNFAKGGTYSANKQAWLLSVQRKPMPLVYHLMPLDSVLQDRFMPSTADEASLAALPARRASLKAALASYCHYLLQQGELSSCDPSAPDIIPYNLYMPFAYGYVPAAPIYYNRECPQDAYLTQMWWREKPGEGLVSLKATCSDGESLHWGDDAAGHWNQVLSCPDGFIRITGKAQQGYGIINVRVACMDQGTPTEFQSNANNAGEWKEPLTCPSDAPVLSGLEVMTTTGWFNDHGIVNYRPRCSNGNAFPRRLQTTMLV